MKKGKIKDKVCGVYQVINKITGESYVGSSKNVWLRMSNHRCYSKYLQCPHSKLYQAYQLYEKEDFEYKLLEECLPEELKQKEQKWIQEIKPEYNTRNASINKKVS